jgi:transposase InsO family protein
LKVLCCCGKVSKSGYYKWLKNRDNVKKEKEEDTFIKAKIKAIYNASCGTYGRERVQIVLKNEYELEVGISRIYRYMRELGIKAVIRIEKNANKHGGIKKGNILDQKFFSDIAFSKLCMDISYIKVIGGFIYLSAVYDLFNGEIIAYVVGENNTLELVASTLYELCKVDLKPNFILHTDQGFQYTHKAYVDFLHDSGVVQSMSGVGNCYDNAPIESFFGTLKCECLYLNKKLLSKDETRKMIDDYIHYYNNDRIKVKLKMSPVKYREQQAAS